METLRGARAGIRRRRAERKPESRAASAVWRTGKRVDRDAGCGLEGGTECRGVRSGRPCRAPMRQHDGRHPPGQPVSPPDDRPHRTHPTEPTPASLIHCRIPARIAIARVVRQGSLWEEIGEIDRMRAADGATSPETRAATPRRRGGVCDPRSEKNQSPSSPSDGPSIPSSSDIRRALRAARPAWQLLKKR
jgi:hypothetical protein